VGGVRVPVSLAAAISERLAGLPAAAVGVLRWAAVLGAEFSVSDVGLVTGRSAGELAAAVDAAVDAGVVAEGGSRLAFRHGLIRQVLYEGIPGPVRAGLHVQAARALAGAGARAERVAAQLVAAPEAGDGEWVWGWLAGEAGVLAYRAPQVAAELLRRALAALPAADQRREVLEAALVTVAFLLVEDEEVERVAGPLLARTHDPGRAAETAWLLAYSLARTGRGDESAAVVEAALARPATSQVWQARLRAQQAMTSAALGQADGAVEMARQALAGAEQAGDRFAVGYALHALGLVAYHRRDQAGSLGHIDRALELIGDDPQTTDLRLLLLSNRAGLLGDLDRQAEAGITIREALALTEQAGTPQLGIVCTAAADYYFELGQWDDALAMLDTAAALLGAQPARLVLHGLAALIAGHRDDWEMAEEHLAAVPVEALDLPGHRPASHRLLMARALAAERAGQPDEAVAVLAQCLDPGLAKVMPHRYLLLPVLARLTVAAGDGATAAAVAKAADDEAKREPLPVKTGAADLCRGLVDGDAGPLLAAATYYEAADRPFDRAQALEDAAALLADHGHLADAHQAFSNAARLYQALGAEWDLRRADARLRRHGIRRGRGGRRAHATQGWESLTPTEGKIASLVAAGRSNPDIAADLFLSRNTVQTHVSHILAKLGAHTRAEIIRLALQHQPGADSKES